MKGVSHILHPRILLPWLITLIALYIAFRGVDLNTLITHVRSANFQYIAGAVVITFLSYILRSYRWEYFFQTPCMNFLDASRTLFLGFFMNNVLPARAGELVRAHVGARVSNQTRTLVLATIASERLCDGLTLSVFFVIFSAAVGDQNISHELYYVSAAFALAALAIVFLVILRDRVFLLAERIQKRFGGSVSTFALQRLKVFINGLGPLLMPSKLPFIVVLSLVIWAIELCVYQLISWAFATNLSPALCVLFMVAVNFSSLIPAAPGGIGVIEAVTTAILVSVGVDREQALSMVLTQHAIQYLVVGLPGALVLMTWRNRVKNIPEAAPNEI